MTFDCIATRLYNKVHSVLQSKLIFLVSRSFSQLEKRKEGISIEKDYLLSLLSV